MKLIALVISIIGVSILLYLLLSPIAQKQGSNKRDYITFCYTLTPKKKAFLYLGRNAISKYKQINKVIIPSEVGAGKTVYDNRGWFTPNTHKGDPFLENSGDDDRIDLDNNITINSHYAYSMNTHSKFIKIVVVNKLYKYINHYYFDKDTFFIAPIDKDYVNSSDGFASQNTYYLRLSEFNITFSNYYNISKTKNLIGIGFVNN